MKPAALTGLLLICVASANAQFRLLPQVGYEYSRTPVQINGQPSFTPMCGVGSVKANLQLDYRFKSGHGAFVAVGTSPAVVKINFENASTASTNYKESLGSIQWRLEGGYMFESKPIKLGKTAAAKSPEAAAPAPQNNCHSYCHHSCGGQSRKSPAPGNTTLRLLPSIGLAYVPSTTEDFSTAGTNYQYNAGNWKTAVVTGMGFELGNGKQRILSLGLYYTKGLNSQSAKTITTSENGKPITTSFQSSSNSWSMTLGIPFMLVKTHKPTEHKTQHQSPCMRYRCQQYHHCTRI